MLEEAGEETEGAAEGKETTIKGEKNLAGCGGVL